MATNTSNEIGVIGQVYEDRRTGKSGKLILRDAKCKTLTFESDDGKPFAVTFNSFRSNMRKKQTQSSEELVAEAYAEAEITSEVLTDDEAKKIEKKIERKERKERKAQEEETNKANDRLARQSDAYDRLKSVVRTFTESFNNPFISVTNREYKHSCALKVRGRIMMVMYSRPKADEVYVVCVPQFISAVSRSVEILKSKHHTAKTAGQLTEVYSVAFRDLAQLLEDHREAIIEILSYVKEESEE